jgi:hypothetical protein
VLNSYVKMKCFNALSVVAKQKVLFIGNILN